MFSSFLSLRLGLDLLGRADDLGENVALAQDQVVGPLDPDLRSAVLREDDGVARGDVHGDALPGLGVATARARGDDAAALRLLDRGVREDDPPDRRLLLLEGLDDQAVSQGRQIHSFDLRFSWLFVTSL